MSSYSPNMEKGFYHPSVGYWQTISDVPDFIRDTYPEGTVEVPLKPGDGYEYSGSEWVPPSQQWLYDRAADLARRERASIMKRFVDPMVTNPLRWADTPDAKKQEWLDYRQALLSISDQEGFPFTIVWPTRPA